MIVASPAVHVDHSSQVWAMPSDHDPTTVVETETRARDVAA